MYSIPVKEEKKDLIPGVIHVDGTSRIQTVTEEQNHHYYHLIKRFYERTGIPLLFNTSFNLAGEVMCYSLEDAIDILRRSHIDYLYLPEEGEVRCIS
jgi:carbamoyltransferase